MPLPFRLIPRATSLHTKLMLALAILVALVAAVSAYVLIERERERRFLELEGRAARIAELFSRSVAYPLWNVDRAEIDSQLAALAPNPEVAQFSITAVGYGTVSAVTKFQGRNLVDPIVRVQAIEYAPPGGAAPQKIGEVRVVLTRAVVEQDIASARRAIVGLVAAIVAMPCRTLHRPIEPVVAMVEGTNLPRLSVDAIERLIFRDSLPLLGLEE